MLTAEEEKHWKAQQTSRPPSERRFRESLERLAAHYRECAGPKWQDISQQKHERAANLARGILREIAMRGSF